VTWLRTTEKAALALILSGIVLVTGIASGPPSASGGIVIFIGPIPVFVGFGDPSLMALLLILMVILTAIGFILLRIGGRSGPGAGPAGA